jgi:hypothetical protein
MTIAKRGAPAGAKLSAGGVKQNARTRQADRPLSLFSLTVEIFEAHCGRRNEGNGANQNLPLKIKHSF